MADNAPKNAWYEVWATYQKNGLRKVIPELFETFSKKQKILLGLIALVFAIFLLLSVIFFASPQGTFFAPMFYVSSIVLALYFQRITREIRDASLFVDDSFYRTIRYRQFKEELSKSDLSAKSLDKCLNILDTEKEIISKGPVYSRQIFTVLFPIAIALIADGLTGGQSRSALVMAGVIILTVASFISTLMLFFRSRTEQLLELELFLKTCLLEHADSSDSLD